ncbi:SET domain protein [Crucibulum laeve]|uniref:SET domain protein n=1 Tax=Crucibulum laeve TaxID=68775 RepID=A0A5C3MEK5_9AGAR|nr:SET domain protein [Crucibulum laeve]
MSADELSAAVSLKNWLQKHGGGFNSYVKFKQASSGFDIIAGENIPVDTQIVSCPFSLVITKDQAQKSLLEILNVSDNFGESWSERQWISCYISLHWISGTEESAPRSLSHFSYFNSLPSPEKLRTPLHFNTVEREAFKGTNLYGATLDRERDWFSEWSQCHDAIAKTKAEWVATFNWEKYLTAATYLSSRAFPSSLLSPTPSLQPSTSTGPVLLPGVDSLNHARGQPVSWVITYPDANATETAVQEPTISLVLHMPAAAGQELFNNYGPKPNSELILGYGFSLPNNPDDTIILKVGGIEGKKWEIGREARGAEGLWNEILSSMLEDPESIPTYEDQLDASGALANMVQAVLDRLPTEEGDKNADIRPEVAMMLHDYLEGQRDVLHSLLAFAQGKEDAAIEIARNEGVDLILKDD